MLAARHCFPPSARDISITQMTALSHEYRGRISRLRDWRKSQAQGRRVEPDLSVRAMFSDVRSMARNMRNMSEYVVEHGNGNIYPRLDTAYRKADLRNTDLFPLMNGSLSTAG